MLDRQRDRRGRLSYVLGIRSLDGSGPQRRGVRLGGDRDVANRRGLASCELPLRNTGRLVRVAGDHPEGVRRYLDSDIFRLSARVRGRGWTTNLPAELVTTPNGTTTGVTVHARNDFAGAPPGRVRVVARSESDPDAVARASCRVRMR